MQKMERYSRSAGKYTVKINKVSNEIGERFHFGNENYKTVTQSGKGVL